MTLGAAGFLLVAATLVAASSPASAATAVTVTFEVSGAQGGGSSGGLGGRVTATVTLDAGTDVGVYVGGSNGFNGGGDAGPFQAGPGETPGGNGGGASDLRIGGATVSDRVLVAGGGGGQGGGWLESTGGGAGGLAGQDGSHGTGGITAGFGGGGATDIAAGAGGTEGELAGPGTAGTGEIGGTGGSPGGDGGAGGGGGGGWFGGGGGGGSSSLSDAGGGGGGSSHVDAMFTGVTTSSGARGGNGLVRMSLDGGSTWVTSFSFTGAPQTYTVPEPPHPASIDPIAGPTGGGTAVTLTGTDLTDTSSVRLCGQPGTGLVVVSDTEVTFATPPGTVGSCDLTVLTNASGTATLTDAFRYFAVPSVTSVDPDNGVSAGGTPVTIHGSGFTGASAPTFGGVTATDVDVVDDTTIVATTPAHANGTVDVVVTTPDASGTGTDAFRYYTSPASLAVSPDSGPTDGGTDVTLTGTDLTDTSAVLVCGQAGTNLDVVSDTEVTFTTPPGDVGTCDVTVQTSASGTATLDAGFRYFAVPAVTSVGPDEGPIAGSTSVTVHGSGFTGATSLTFGGTAAANVTVVDDTTITATTPAHAAGTVDVVVTTPDASGTGTDAFTYNAPPSSLDVTPGSGPAHGGTAVTLSGTHLAETTAVLVCGEAGTNLDVVSDAEVTFTTPPGAVGTCDVTVETDASGSTTLDNGFRYFAVPAVTSVDPSEGPIAGGIAVTVNGSGFTGATSVTFGGAVATDLDVVNGTTITATLPAHVVGPVDVVVTTPDASGTGTDAFTYDAPPSSLTVSPVAGPVAGGTTITITGADLATTSGVTVGGTAATDVTVQDDTTVTAVVPAGVLGEADVVVTTAGGSTTLTDAFTYTETADLDLGASSVAWGSTLDVHGQGFDPGSEVTLTLHSAPVVLGTVAAGDDGRFTTTVTIPVIEPGDHVLSADGVDALGQPLALEATVTVTASSDVSDSNPIVTGSQGAAPTDDAPTASSAGADSLPKTGTDPMGPLTTGLGLVVAGIGICVTRRRRLS